MSGFSRSRQAPGLPMLTIGSQNCRRTYKRLSNADGDDSQRQEQGAISEDDNELDSLQEDPGTGSDEEDVKGLVHVRLIRNRKTTGDEGIRSGIAGLKNRKAGTSFIPRHVHAKKSDRTVRSVSALAKHFERLSREFEKERIRDRKARAAKLQSSRAFWPRIPAKVLTINEED